MTILLLTVWLPGCGSVGDLKEGGAANIPRAAVLPGVGLGPEDDIDAVDLAVEPGDVLHVAWRQVERATPPRYTTVYARAERGGVSWTTPEVLDAAGGEPPRLVLGAGAVHLLAGRRITHLLRPDGGAWREVGHLSDGEYPVAPALFPELAFDAAATAEGLVAAYLSRKSENDPIGLYFVRWTTAGSTSPRLLAEFSRSVFDQASPRLLVRNGRLHLLCAINREIRERVETGAGAAESFTSRAKLFYLRSDDQGHSWMSPVELTVGLDPGPQTISSVELVTAGPGLVALYTAHGLFAASSVDGRSWARPVGIARNRKIAGGGGSDAWSITAAQGFVAWIDQRFRASDRRAWNPLGGWPWSDAPDWINNDVFVLPLAQVEAALNGRDAEPVRQTWDLSYARRARLHASQRAIYLLWAGRRAVGKSLSARGAAPEIFFRRLKPFESPTPPPSPLPLP